MEQQIAKARTMVRRDNPQAGAEEAKDHTQSNKDLVPSSLVNAGGKLL